MKYGLAVLACLGITFVFLLISVAVGWRHGGGVIPQLILLAILSATWLGITKGQQGKADTSRTTAEPAQSNPHVLWKMIAGVLFVILIVVVATVYKIVGNSAPIQSNTPTVSAPVVVTPSPRHENKLEKPKPVEQKAMQRVEQGRNGVCPRGWGVDFNRSGYCISAGGAPQTGPCDFSGAMSDQDFINCGRKPPG